ncbi:MAG: antitoxin component YwqK of YwqJK toxin-antitoxin module [Arenicella sp.]|jgi:antitoxin component YwqK of YwqJK toxin-antitoxin module
MGRYSLFLISLIFGLSSFGQSDTLNQKDAEGKKQGYWIITGHLKPEKGHCDNCKVEEGKYVDNRKDGVYIKYFPNGNKRMTATYTNGRPDGIYTKYWENGNKKENGEFRERKQINGFLKYHQNGTLVQTRNFNKDGKEDGRSIYYYENCDPTDTILRKQLDVIRIDGVLRGKLYTYYYSGCVQKVVGYDDEGKASNPMQYEDNCNLQDSIPIGNEGISERKRPCDLKVNPHPLPSPPVRIPPALFDPDGYNKLYNKNDELWMDGYFRKGKLYEGKLYKYDSDGVLIKIEIWKQGKYHSDSLF